MVKKTISISYPHTYFSVKKKTKKWTHSHGKVSTIESVCCIRTMCPIQLKQQSV